MSKISIFQKKDVHAQPYTRLKSIFGKADNGTFITDYDLKGPNDGGCWDDFEEALNDGIYNACKMIKKKKDESNKRNNNRR